MSNSTIKRQPKTKFYFDPSKDYASSENTDAEQLASNEDNQGAS